VRALVRIEGRHVGASGRAWLPFCVRVALHAGGRSVRIVHSFVFDGDAASDFIAGLGLRFDAPLDGDLHNRHVRFAGEGEGLWSEAVRNIPGWRPGVFRHADLFQEQLAGRPVMALAEMDEASRAQLETVPAWDDFRLEQTSAGRFQIEKRTSANASWLAAGHGARASGLGYVGGAGGGVAFGVRDFWQRCPTALHVDGARGARAAVTLWLWSPQAGAMDLRHYSDQAHGLQIQYEDITEGFSTPTGIARTSEIMLWCAPATPTRETLADYAATVRAPPLLACAPERYHELGAFGVISTTRCWRSISARSIAGIGTVSGISATSCTRTIATVIPGATMSAATPGPTANSRRTCGSGRRFCAAGAPTFSAWLKR
jgi:hypothetical protein